MRVLLKKDAAGKGIAISSWVWYDIGHGVIVLQGGSLPNLQKKGGGVDGNVFVSGFDSVCDIFNYTACLHR